MEQLIIKILSFSNIFLLTILLSTTPAIAQDSGLDTLSDPLTNLTTQQLEDFEAGLVVFSRPFGPVIGGGGFPAIGGGPMRNTFGPNSCVACHGQALDSDGVIDNTKDGGGHNVFRALQVTAYNEVEESCDHLGDRGGPGFQINTGALPSMGLFKLAQEPVNADFIGEYIPLVSQHGIPVGPRDDRTTNDLFGLGLLDAMPDWKLWLRTDPWDVNGDGISGRANWVTDHNGRIGIGKFGRKSEVAHLDEFNAEAFQNEQGVTNPEFMDDGILVTGKVLGSLQDLITVTLDDGFLDPEVSEEDMDLLNAYVRFLAPPAQNLDALSRRDRKKGKKVFRDVGCDSCHTPRMVTGWSKHKVLRWKVIKPYSDLLLHDMGPDLAEGCKADATPSEWRTEPLWGLRFVTAGYMHDGRAATIEEAIDLHGGEGAGSRDAYDALNATDQTLLLDFLNTL
jgi:CxxC motif-containing protein (DUF1111 family)